MWMRRLVLAAALASGSLPAVVRPASAADRVQQCIGEHVEAQLLRNRGRLLAARDRLLECSKPACPALVRDECVALTQKIEVALPSVIPSALDAAGEPTTAPMLRVDDSPNLLPLDGRSLSLDPGEHQLHFVDPHGETREMSLVLVESEHGRSVVADFRPAQGDTSPLSERRWTNVMLISAGIAAVSLGSFTYFALSGHAAQNELRRCKPACESRAEIDQMRSRYLVADISLGLALVSLGVGTYAWTQRSSAASASHSSSAGRLGVSLLPVAADGHVGLWASGEF